MYEVEWKDILKVVFLLVFWLSQVSVYVCVCLEINQSPTPPMRMITNNALSVCGCVCESVSESCYVYDHVFK